MEKDRTLAYMQMPLPVAGKAYKTAKREWQGLNLREKTDTGDLSFEKNISTVSAPHLTPAPKPERVYGDENIASGSIYPIGLFGFDDFLLYIYRTGSSIYADYIKGGVTYTGKITESASSGEESDYQRCVVQFNVYDVTTDTLTGSFKKRLLIFPDKVAMDFDISREFTGQTAASAPPQDADTAYLYGNKNGGKVWRYENGAWTGVSESREQFGFDTMEAGPLCLMPDIKYATVHLSRLFGVDDGRIYASGFNDYTNWNLDTADEYNESNAWCSPTQSNSKADGNFTGITTFGNHVICFKKDFMHEIYNTKNPFRVQDIYAEGAVDNRTIHDVDGKLIFASSDDIKVYTGGNPRILSYKLGLSSYEGAVSGTDGRNYYLYLNKKIYVYDTVVGEWSVRQLPPESDGQEGSISEIRDIINFAHNKKGMYCLTAFGGIFKLDTEDFDHDWSFETDLMTSGTVDIKHIRKIQLLADIGTNAGFKVYFLYDDETFDAEKSHLVFDSTGRTGQTAVRVKPKMTAHYGIKLHFEGHGYVKLGSLELITEQGGEKYV